MSQQSLLQHTSLNGPGLNPVSTVGTPPVSGPTPHGQAQPTHVFQQTTTTSLEWKISGLKAMFEQTRGDSKSRVIKSALFGGGRWQILLYLNAGGPVGCEWTSLYLSCEPLPEEYLPHPPFPAHAEAPSLSSTAAQKLSAESRPFERKGNYRFAFSISAGDKVIAAKEDKGHEFHTAASNWGWSNYCRRDSLYFDNVLVRRLDCIVIRCDVTSEPETPRLPDPLPRTLVSTDLVDVVGRLLDQESVSDVEFIIVPSRRGTPSAGRTIWANRTMLARADYFQTMLSSGFAEDLRAGVSELALTDEDDLTPVLSTGLPELEDSDRSDADLSSDDGEDEDDDEHFLSTSSPTPTSSSPASSPAPKPADLPAPIEGAVGDTSKGRDRSGAQSSSSSLAPMDVNSAGVHRSNDAQTQAERSEASRRNGPRKTRVVIRDAAYSTYYALLFFLYTETITFAPLTSSFHRPATAAVVTTYSSADARPSHAHNPSTSSSYRSFETNSAAASATIPRWTAARARKAWIDEWCTTHEGRPQPASAKSVYALADKMGLEGLKAKAFEHIVEHLTVDNIAYEAFSNFSAAYDAVRRVHVEYFLRNWTQIKSTAAMHSIWHELRSGRHAGFEDVWPLIVSRLEVVPRPLTLPAGGSSEGGQGLDFGPA